MLVKTFGSAVFGIDATTITVEVNLGIGINFYLVGLPDSAVKESQQRIKAAFKDRKSTRLNSSHSDRSRMPSSA